MKTAIDTQDLYGFTLIELCVVLVIIGLIAGTIMVGQDLITAAAVNAQIVQIQKYNSAAITFRTKYSFLPGDIPAPYASNYGFPARGSYAGEGDGNGVLEGNCTNSAGTNGGFYEGDGELATFWVDLSMSGLIGDSISASGSRYPNSTTIPSPTITPGTTPNVSQWLPKAKIDNNYVFVYSLSSVNYFSISPITDIGCAIESSMGPLVSVQQAYMIDSKTDDGIPQSGNTTACYVNHQVAAYQAVWAAGGLNQGTGGANCTPATTATSYATTNCFDNSNVAGTQKYSIAQNAGLRNCALSFRFQ